ncbi:MAG: metal-dependent hydrolase [Pseudomonadota bacterium]|nr:metal-dependent hydrolase [Pseudomonadota bacterium]
MNATSMSNLAPAAIVVRRQQFSFDTLPLYYFKDNPLLSHLLTALSLTFPTGERFFVHSVRQVRDQVTDPILQRDISAFIGQEAMHSHAHEDFNAFAASKGLDVQPVIDFENEKIEQVKHHLTAKQQLAVTCALEHFTAIIARYVLENPDFHNGLHPQAAKLWLWHALEETEHKAVAFDTYKAIFDDEIVRKRVMRIITTTFLTRISQITLTLLLKDSVGRKQFRQHWAGFKEIIKLVRTLTPAYRDYYHADFHPNQQNTTALTAYWAANIEAWAG